MRYKNFIWDEEKEVFNIQKHGVTFIEGASVFDDNNAIYIYDKDHSIDEDRYIVIGFSEAYNLLLVCHCYKNSDKLIRIFSARKPTKQEEKLYGRNNKL